MENKEEYKNEEDLHDFNENENIETTEDENEYEVLSPEELEEREKMRDLLINTFSDNSILYQIYEKRDWLDRLFTDRILSMDKNNLYSTKQVADICETETYNINNKRKEFIDYVNPQIMGDKNSKNWKHDYISVFKLKMIDVLTGQGGDFTLQQLKRLLYGDTLPKTQGGEDGPLTDRLMQLVKGYESQLSEYRNQMSLLSGDELEKEIHQIIDKKIDQKLASLPAPESGSEHIEKIIDDKLKELQGERPAKQKAIELYEKIISSDTPIKKKESTLVEFRKLEEDYPEDIYTIRLYHDLASDKIRTFLQDERELHVKKVKERALDLFKMYYDHSLSKSSKDHAFEQLQQLMLNEPDLEFDIRSYISQIMSDKDKNENKGFFKRLFG